MSSGVRDRTSERQTDFTSGAISFTAAQASTSIMDIWAQFSQYSVPVVVVVCAFELAICDSDDSSVVGETEWEIAVEFPADESLFI